jgi:hypothetical protein
VAVSSDTVPGVVMRLTKSVSEARAIWLDVVAAGSDVRSNWRKLVLPLPT